MKRLAIFCDGTWQKPNMSDQTNVVKLARIVAPHDKEIPQLVFYDPGVGSKRGTKHRGGLLGKGINTNIAQAYLFLALKQQPKPDPTAPYRDSFRGIFKLAGRKPRDFGSLSETNEIDESVIARVAANPEYAPVALEKVEQEVQQRVDDFLPPPENDKEDSHA